MKDRVVTLGLAAAALIVFYALIFPKPQRPQPSGGSPVSTDGRPDGYLAVWRWLGRERIPRVSLRDRYSRLPRLVSRPQGNVLLVTLPQREPMQAVELDDLKRWVSRGNTVLIAAALDDTPSWALSAYDPLELTDLRRLTGLKFKPEAAASALDALARPLVIRPRARQPLLQGVGELRSVPTLPTRLWQAHQTGRNTPLALASVAHVGVPAVWLLPLGDGQIILTAVASPFSNAGLALGGNARFLANVLAWSRGPGGAVIFDDGHQGLAAFYDAAAFFADPRLHATLIWLVVLWLVFVLGSQPLRAASSRSQPLDESVYIEGSARYLAAVVSNAEIARRLIENLLRMPGGTARGAPEISWARLERQPGVSPEDYRALQAVYARACTGGRVDLPRLQSFLARLRKTLT